MANEEPLNPPKQWTQLSRALSKTLPDRLTKIRHLSHEIRGVAAKPRAK